MYMKSGYVKGTDVKDIDPESKINFLPSKDIYIRVKGHHFFTLMKH